jgi:polyisoprenoid-binding protein YceI
MRIISGVIAASGLCLALAACDPTATGAPTSAPAAISTAAPVTTSAANAAPATATAGSLPTAAARPTQAVGTLSPTQATGSAASATQSAPSSGSAQTTAAAAQGTAAAADAVRLVLDSSASQASYHAREQLVGKSLPSDAVGTSKSVSGSVVLGADGSVLADQSKISVDLTKLQSNESRRDNFIKSDTLQTSRFPVATFAPNEIQGLPMPLPTAGQVTFQLLGDLTVHGVTKPVTWQVTATFADSTVSGSATTAIKITDFGMTPPRAGPVLSIEDALTLELAFTAARG